PASRPRPKPGSFPSTRRAAGSMCSPDDMGGPRHGPPISLGAPRWPPDPQLSSRPGEPVTLLDGRDAPRLPSRALLEVTNLTKHFVVRRGALGWSTGLVRAVDSVSFEIPAGSTLGLVGESGCGKTTTSKLILALEKPTAGSIRFQYRDVSTLAGEGERAYRRSVQAVFQDPFASLDPRMRVGTIVSGPLVITAALAAAGRR